MEVTSTTQITSSTTQSRKVQESAKISFLIEANKELDPLSISFDEYQTLSKDDIETIYQNEPKPQENKGNALSLYNQATWTDDTTLNKILFDNHIESIRHGGDKSIMTFHAMVMAGIPDMINYEIDPDNLMFSLEQTKNSPFIQDIISKRDGIKSEKPEPTVNTRDSKELLAFFRDLEDFFEKAMSEGWSGNIDEKKIFENVNDILIRYDNQIEENNAILESYTKTTKQLSLEELQKQKDEEQFVLAMKGHDMNPNSDLERFAFKFMQQGYRKEEAIERTNIYSMMGLVPREHQVLDDSQINYVGIITHNPKFKESLEESFEKMTTKQLQKTAHSISVSIPMEEIISGNPSHEEIMKRAAEYWTEGNGAINKIVDTLYREMKDIDVRQKFTTDDLSYIKEGFQILIDTFNNNFKGK